MSPSGAFAENAVEEPGSGVRTVFYPQIGYTPELGWLFGAAGLIIYDPIGAPPEPPALAPDATRVPGVEPAERPSNTLILSGFYTTTTAYQLSASSTQYLFRDRLLLDTAAAFSEVPTEFFGIGSDAAPKEDYLGRGASGDIAMLFRILPRVRVGPRLRATRYWVSERDDGGLLAAESIAGAEGATVLIPAVELRYDTRPAPFDPHEGSAFVLHAARAHPASSESFGRLGVEYLQITPFFGHHRIATQYVLEHVFDTAPFQELPRLGGSSLLRGLTAGRYRDRTLVAAQAEYRSPYLRRFGLEVFGGVGQVASDLDELDGRDLVAAGGAGLRFQVDPESGFVLRLNLAYSEPEGSPRFYVGAGDAF